MSIPIPPSESKGMSMREYQRLYPHALSQQTLTESRMVHRAMLHRLHKDQAEWKNFYRWQRVKSYHKHLLLHGAQLMHQVAHGLGRWKHRFVNFLLHEKAEPLSSTIQMKLPRKVSSTAPPHPASYRF